MAKTFDGPPTLERSGSEHRRAVTSFLLRRKAWLEVELSLQERRRGRKFSTVGRLHPLVPEGFCPPKLGEPKGGGVKTIEERLGEKGGAFLKGKEGRVGFRKKITSIFLGKNPFSIRKDFQSPSAPHVLYPSRKD